jgi:hypothetical protein
VFEIVQDQVGCQAGWEVVTGIIENCRQCVINGNQVENDADSSKSSDALDLAKSTSVLLEDKNLLGVSGPCVEICLSRWLGILIRAARPLIYTTTFLGKA